MRKKSYIDLSTVAGRQLFYQSKEWRSIRLLVLAENPWCVECLRKGLKVLATDVDHIIDIKEDQSKFMDKENLQGLCRSCHSIKTMKSNMYCNINPKFTSSHKKWEYIKK